MCMDCWDPEGLLQLEVLVRTHDGATRLSEESICPSCLKTFASGGREITISETITAEDTFTTRDKSQRRAIKKQSMRRELEGAEAIGGRTTPASGALVAKGDFRNAGWAIEDKFTKASSFRITKALIYKIVRDAASSGRGGALRIGIDGLNAAVLLWEDFVELIQDDRNTNHDTDD